MTDDQSSSHPTNHMWQDELTHIEDTLRSESLVFAIEHVIDSCSCSGKRCPKCGQVKCHGAFTRNKSTKDGLDSYCRVCLKVRRANYYQRYIEQERERSREYHRAKRQIDPTYDKIRSQAYRETHPEWTKEYYKKNKERIEERGKVHYQSNRERYREQKRAYREAHVERERVRRQNNREHHREQKRIWRRNNPGYYLEYQQVWRRNNPALWQKYQQAWRQNNPEYLRVWYRNNPGRVTVNNSARRTRKKQANGSFTAQEWENLKAYYAYTCLCCGKSEPHVKLTVDHVIPLTKGGSNSIDNIQPLCKSCNSSKHTKVIDYRARWQS